MDELAAALIFIAFFGFIAFLIWNRSSVNLERRKMRIEAQNQLLEKLSSAEALNAFLESDEGRRFLGRLRAPDDLDRGLTMRGAFLGLITLGAMALGVGVGALLSTEMDEPAGAIIVGGAVGTLLAAGIQYALSKQWGLLDSRDETPGSRTG